MELLKKTSQLSNASEVGKKKKKGKKRKEKKRKEKFGFLLCTVQYSTLVL